MPQLESDPRLLWSICHPTLVRTEVPILSRSGFEVDIQDPLADQMRPVEVVEYPTLEELLPHRVNDSNDERKLGPRSRLNVRTRKLSSREYERLNDEYDAVMVATSIHRAVNLARRFRGIVFFRDYGRLPGRQVPRRRPPLRVPSNIVHVPIFSAIEPQLAKLKRPPSPLFTLPPSWPDRPHEALDVHAGSIAVFAAAIAETTWFHEWLRGLVSSAGHLQVRVFGASNLSRASIETAGATWVPRLADDEYRQAFRQNDLWVYPYKDPAHSHYIPMEAINLGIPCLMPRATAVPFESRAQIGSEFREYGLVDDIHELVDAVKELTSDQGRATAVAGRQKELMRPFRPENIERQAKQLARLARSAQSRTRLFSRPNGRVNPAEVGPPSAKAYLSSLRNPEGIGSCRVPSATLASPYWIRQDLDADLVPPRGGGAYRFLSLRHGGDTRLALAAPAFRSNVGGDFRVEVDVAASSQAPFAIEAIRNEIPVAVFPMHVESVGSRNRPWTRYCAQLNIQPEEGLSVRIINSLAPRGTLIGDVVVSAVSAGETESSGQFPGGPQLLPVWPAMHLNPRTLAIQRFLGSGLALMRVDMGNPALQDLRRKWVQFVTVPTNGLSLSVVVSRGASWRRVRPIAAFGPWGALWSRPGRFDESSYVMALGTRRGLMNIHLSPGHQP